MSQLHRYGQMTASRGPAERVGNKGGHARKQAESRDGLEEVRATYHNARITP